MVFHTVRIIQQSGWGLEAAIEHSAAPRAVLSFLTPPLVLYYTYYSLEQLSLAGHTLHVNVEGSGAET